MRRVYESLVPSQLTDCVRWKEKGVQGGREGTMVNVIKNSGGTQRIPMCCEWGHWVGCVGGRWPLPGLHTPPLCLSIPPPHLMMHNGFLSFNEPDGHTGSILTVSKKKCCKTRPVHCNAFLNNACLWVYYLRCMTNSLILSLSDVLCDANKNPPNYIVCT